MTEPIDIAPLATWKTRVTAGVVTLFLVVAAAALVWELADFVPEFFCGFDFKHTMCGDKGVAP